MLSPAITVKGQVTIPKSIRDMLGLNPGVRVQFVPTDQGAVLLQPAPVQNKVLENPFTAFLGLGKGGVSTDAHLQMTRGDDWNQP